MSEFGDYLRSLRKERKLSLRAAQQAVGVSPSCLSALETGKSAKPSFDILLRLARLYSVPTAEMLTRAGVAVGDDLDGLGVGPAAETPVWMPPRPRNRELRALVKEGSPLVSPALVEMIAEVDAYYEAWARLRDAYFLALKEKAELVSAVGRRQAAPVIERVKDPLTVPQPKLQRATPPKPTADFVVVYSDGSYDRARNAVGIGAVVRSTAGTLGTISERLLPVPGLLASWAEWEAALRGVKLALDFGAKKVLLVTDYQEIQRGHGQTGRPGTRDYLLKLSERLESLEIRLVNRGDNAEAHQLAYRAMKADQSLQPWLTVEIPGIGIAA